jgi:coenzyme F420-reducing hydrogenase gamma subunit
MVAKGIPCLGPVTHAGCGAICPAYNRGCYGCFGPADVTNIPALVPALAAAGMSPFQLTRVFRTFNAEAPAFREASTGAEIAESIR